MFFEDPQSPPLTHSFGYPFDFNITGNTCHVDMQIRRASQNNGTTVKNFANKYENFCFLDYNGVIVCT